MFERDSFVLLNPDGTIPWTANQDANGYRLINLLDPVNPQDAATRAYVLANGGSQTPWTSDIDAAGFGLNAVASVSVAGLLGGTTFYSFDEIDSSGNSQFYLTQDANFGIHNGEAAGVGADINLVSDNGANVFTDIHGTLTTKAVNVSGTDYETLFWSKAGNPCVFSIESDFDQNGVFCFESFDAVIANFSPHFLRAANSHDIGIGIPLVGNVWNCSAGTGIMSFTGPQHYFGTTTEDGSLATVQVTGINDGTTPALSVQSGPVFIGATADDGTGATVQITGSLSINGVLVAAP